MLSLFVFKILLPYRKMRAALVSERYDEKSVNEKENIGTRHSDTYAIVWMRECMYKYVCCVLCECVIANVLVERE